MLCCPARSPTSASRRFPGGIRRSSIRPAIWSCRSLRRATDSMAPKRFTRLPRARDSVSALPNDTITSSIVTSRVHNGKRDGRGRALMFLANEPPYRSSCDAQGRDMPHLVLRSQPGIVEIDRSLEVQPEFRRVVEQATQPQRHLRTHRPSFSNELVHGLATDAEGRRKPVNLSLIH